MQDSDAKPGFKIVLGRPNLPNSPDKNKQRKLSTDEDIKPPKSKPQSCRKPKTKPSKKEKLKLENEVMPEAVVEVATVKMEICQ